MVAVKRTLNSRQRDDIECNARFHNEMIIVEVKQSNGERIGILSVYHPPDDLNFEFSLNMKHENASNWRPELPRSGLGIRIPPEP